MKALGVLCALVLAATAVAAAQITLRSPFSDNGRLACRPKFACVSGIVTPAAANNPAATALNVATILIEVAGKTAIDTVPYKKGGEWRACLAETVEASASNRYDLVVTGLSKNGAVIETLTVRSMSFGHGLVLDGQSNMMLPIAAATIPGDLVLTNATRLVAEWAEHNFYDVAFMIAGTGATALSPVPRVTFPVINKNWTRSDTPGFGAWLTTSLTGPGWLAVVNCIDHARLNGPTHCLQIAVPSTRIEAHLSAKTYVRSGMTVAKPFTTAGTELLQMPGGLWNSKLAIRDWQPDAWHFRQGEANFNNPYEYAVLINALVDDIFETFVDSAPSLDKHVLNDDADASPVKSVVTVYGLPAYNGLRTWTVPPSTTVVNPANPPFNLTAKALYSVKNRRSVCFVPIGHLGYFTFRDGGLHTPDTAMDAAIAASECHQNLVATAKAKRDPTRPRPAPVLHVVSGPVPATTSANVTAWDSTTGAVTIVMEFETQPDPATGEPVDIAWSQVARPFATAPSPFSYSQFTGTQFSLGAAQPSTTTVSTEGRVMTLSFVVERPQFGMPTTLVYSYLSDFANYLITNNPEASTPHPHWFPRAPMAADPFSVPLINVVPLP